MSRLFENKKSQGLMFFFDLFYFSGTPVQLNNIFEQDAKSRLRGQDSDPPTADFALLNLRATDSKTRMLKIKKCRN